MKHKIIVLGANGLTGQLVVEHLLKADQLLRLPDGTRGWAVAGRNREKIEESLHALSATDVEIFHADLEEPSTLNALAEKAKVILNLAGPYTPRAEQLISACIDAGTSYVDLSGEIPLLRRVIQRFDEAARAAKVQIVQMCGWEAFPADVATLMASRKVLGTEQSACGANAPIAEVTVTIQIENQFEGMLPLNQMVSAGTLASIVQMLEDPEANLIGLEESLFPEKEAKSLTKEIKIESFEFGGKIYGPVVPVPFLNPPIIRRTGAILARENNAHYLAATYREGIQLGSDSSGLLKAQGAVSSYVQSILSKITLLPLVLRKPLAQGLKKVLPPSGSGPSGKHLRDWTWTVEAHATTLSGEKASWGLKGVGHPGYTSTAAMIVETGLQMVLAKSQYRGCITPALVFSEEFEKFFLEDLQTIEAN